MSIKGLHMVSFKCIILCLFVLLPREGNCDEVNRTYHRVLRSAPVCLDPATTISSYEVQVMRQMYDQLISYDKNHMLCPKLASSWSISKDGRLYIFYLRKDVKFSDGSPLTTKDVIYSLTRLIGKPESMFASDLFRIKGAREYRSGTAKSVAGVRAAGDTVEIELNKANPFLLSILASTGGSIIKHNTGDLPGQVPIGTGPFIVACRNKSSVVMDANANYFLGAPKLKRVVYHIYPDKHSMHKDFKAGRLDDMAPYNLPPSEQRSSYKRVFSGAIASFIIMVHQRRAPMDNAYLRKALIMAVDFDAIFRDIQEYYPNLARSFSYIPRGRPGYSPDIKGLGYDPQKAQEMLRLAGYASFAEVPPITLAYAGNLVYTEELIRGMKAYYDRIGLDFRPHKETVGDTEAGKWQMEMIGADTVYPDSYFPKPHLHSGSGNDYFAVNDSKLKAMLESAESESLPARRISILAEINRHVVESGHVIPLYSGDMFDGTFQKWVEGIRYPETAFYDLVLYPMDINQSLAEKRQVGLVSCAQANIPLR